MTLHRDTHEQQVRARCRSTATAPSRRSTCPTAPGRPRTITQAPRWLSTDLRDGNQALIDPMSPTRKHGDVRPAGPDGLQGDRGRLPRRPARPTSTSSASSIEGDRVPEDVTISVLTQAREDLIERSVQSLVGVPRANIHLYNALAPLFRRVVFHAGHQRRDPRHRRPRHRDGDEVRRGRPAARPSIGYEYSPGDLHPAPSCRSRSSVCEAVSDVWQPEDGREIILNLPATVEMATPNVVRRPDRVVLPPADPARAHRDQPAPAQRPRHRGRRHRAGHDGRRRPRRGLPVRPRRAHRQRRPGDPGR